MNKDLKTFVAQDLVLKPKTRLRFYYFYWVGEMAWNKPWQRNTLLTLPSNYSYFHGFDFAMALDNFLHKAWFFFVTSAVILLWRKSALISSLQLFACWPLETLPMALICQIYYSVSTTFNVTKTSETKTSDQNSHWNLP